MEFLQEGSFVPTVGMNSAGLFASCQMLYPEADVGAQVGASEMYTWLETRLLPRKRCSSPRTELAK